MQIEQLNTLLEQYQGKGEGWIAKSCGIKNVHEESKSQNTVFQQDQEEKNKRRPTVHTQQTKEKQKKSASFSPNHHETCLYNFDPLKPHFYIVKLGFTRVYIIILISAQKHRLWVVVRTALARRF